ncbi:ubiquitin- ligase BRE1 isoform 2 [Schistosoma japonicum]|uniref:Ubiquitin-ligase BRE1 isoform 2 n=1 Tax=Schistosoma japonicum TaxID=6182 RepID=A0A4Z2CY70_SCHJA|nr:ubiquitin- ligase BRE1 isoform 2 [Schistosoma japonicum]
MKVEFTLPSTLQYGDCIEVNGKAGNDKFSIDLISDYLAFDPTAVNDQDKTNECELPIVETQPLQILIETTGSWDINANSPETSTSSHGSSAKRFGFRANEYFVCRVVIKTEYYVVYLNDMVLSNSEHLVPVGSINGFTIDGDSVISTILFGDLSAIEKYHLKHDVKQFQSTNPKIIECRLTSDELLATVLCSDNEENSKTYDYTNQHIGNNIIISSFRDDNHNTKHYDIYNGDIGFTGDQMDREQACKGKYSENLKTGHTGSLCNTSNLLTTNTEIQNQLHNNNNPNRYLSNSSNQKLSNSNGLIRASSYQLVFDVDSDSNEETDGNSEVNETSMKAINRSLINQARAKSIQNLFHFQQNHYDNYDHVNNYIHQKQHLLTKYEKNSNDHLNDTINTSLYDSPFASKSLEQKEFNEMNTSNHLSGKVSSSQILELVREEFELDAPNDDHVENLQIGKNKSMKENLTVKNENVALQNPNCLSNFVKSINDLTVRPQELSETTLLNSEETNLANNKKHEEDIISKQLSNMTCESKIPIFQNNLFNKNTSGLLVNGVQETKLKPLKSACKNKINAYQTNPYLDDCSTITYSDKQALNCSRIPQPISSIPNSNSNNNTIQSNNQMNENIHQETSLNELLTKSTSQKSSFNKRSNKITLKSEVTSNPTTNDITNKNIINQNPLKSSRSLKNRKSYPLLISDMKSLNTVRNGTSVVKTSIKQSPTKFSMSSSVSSPSPPSTSSSLSSLSTVLSPTSVDKPPLCSNGLRSRIQKTIGTKNTTPNQQGNLKNGNLTDNNPTIKLKSTNDTPLDSVSNDERKRHLDAFNQSIISQQCKLVNQVNATITTKLKERDHTMLTNRLHSNPGLNDSGLINCTQPLCENNHILNNVDNCINNVKQDNELNNDHPTYVNGQSNTNHNDSINDSKKHLNGNITSIKSNSKEINYSDHLKSSQNGYTVGNSVNVHDEVILNVKENNYVTNSIAPSSIQSNTTPSNNTMTASVTSLMNESTTSGQCCEKVKSSKKFIQSPKKWLTPS